MDNAVIADVAGTKYKATGREIVDPGYTAIENQTNTVLNLAHENTKDPDPNDSGDAENILPSLSVGTQMPVSVTALSNIQNHLNPILKTRCLLRWKQPGKQSNHLNCDLR